MKKLLLTGILLMSVLAALAGCSGGSGGDNPKSWVVSTFSDYAGSGWGMAFDTLGNLYVADHNNNLIIKITTAGTSSTFSTGAPAYFAFPRGIAVDDSDNLYICNDGYHDIVKITPGPVCSIYTGTKGTSGNSNSPPVTFNHPYGLALNRTSHILYVADSVNAMIRKIDLTSGTVSDFHSTTTPYGVAVDSAGKVYTCSGTDNIIHKFTVDGDVDNNYTLWANPLSPQLYGIAVDGSGNIYAADYANYIIWKIDSGGHASVLAGTPGTPGSTNGAASSAKFSHPYGVAVDSQGRIYVTEENGGIRRIVYQ